MSDPKPTPEPYSNGFKEVFDKQRAKALELRSAKLNERAKRLKKLQLWIEKNEKAIQDAVYRDFKKPALEVSVSEIYPVITEIKHALGQLSEWAKPQKIDAPIAFLGTTSFIQYEPKGVCLIIAPWNFPFNLAIGPLVSALAAGNTVILKPSEMTPHTSELIDTMIGEIYTEDEVRVFNGGVEVSKALLELPFDHIFFTGSPAVGKIVMKAASENLSSVTLELGGKSPAIVDESANLKDAAEKIAWGKFLNNGQTCIAPDYILVHHAVQEEFLSLLKSNTNKLFNNHQQGFQASEDYARMVNENHFNRVKELIQETLDKGGKVVMGNELDPTDNFISPTILTDIPESARIMEEEIFGPVLPVIPYNSLEDAVTLINNKPKPLALYYFGSTRKNQKYVLNNTSSGGACVNDCVIHFNHPNLPFGGVNNSGFGKAHGWHGFMAFSNEKAVLKQRTGYTNIKMVYPPYNRRVKQVINLLTKYF